MLYKIETLYPIMVHNKILFNYVLYHEDNYIIGQLFILANSTE